MLIQYPLLYDTIYIDQYKGLLYKEKSFKIYYEYFSKKNVSLIFLSRRIICVREGESCSYDCHTLECFETILTILLFALGVQTIGVSS